MRMIKDIRIKMAKPKLTRLIEIIRGTGADKDKLLNKLRKIRSISTYTPKYLGSKD
jgi:hypothetical protein